MSYVPHPVQLRYREEDRVLFIKYSDDREAEYPTALLRGFCPCAHCQGHSGGPPTWVPLRTDASSRIDDVHQVGNYAFTIVWGDGHDTGIYAFKFLRAIDTDAPFDADELEAGDELDVDWEV